MKKTPLPLLFLFALPALAADPGLTECRQIKDVEERVACYDEFVDSRFGETSPSIEQIEQIEATVADVRDTAGSKMVVLLDNGQTWRQLDNKTLHLENGEAVVVRRASLGSYLLEKKSGSRPVRVKRLD